MNKEIFKKSIIPILISTILVMIISNFKIFGYDKFFLIPITILTITTTYILNTNDMIINKKGYFYLIPIILIILGTVIFRTNISNMILNVIIIPILLSFLFFTLTNSNFKVSGLFLKWFYKLFPASLFTNLKYTKGNFEIDNTKKKQIGNIIKGILISIPFVIVILFLLRSADAYFNVFVDKIFKNIDLLFNFNTIKNNILVFVIYFIILFSIFVNIIKNKNTILNSRIKKHPDSSIINTILIMINLVFTLFIISEISKITGNFLKIPEEYTYALYAREGFFQLLAVTVINFSIIFYLLYRTDIINNNKLLKRLILLLITFTIILVFSSYYRMYLYIDAYGFTVLRMQVILFLTMELIISIIVIKKILSKLIHQDAYIFSSIIITTYIINIYICNIDLISLINRLIKR